MDNLRAEVGVEKFNGNDSKNFSWWSARIMVVLERKGVYVILTKDESICSDFDPQCLQAESPKLHGL